MGQDVEDPVAEQDADSYIQEFGEALYSCLYVLLESPDVELDSSILSPPWACSLAEYRENSHSSVSAVNLL